MVAIRNPLSAAAALLAAVASVTVGLANPSPADTSGHAESIVINSTPFAPNSPFNTRLVAGATVDPKSTTMIAWAARDKAMYANIGEFGIPIYTGSSSSAEKTVTVRCTITEWGPCPFAGYQIPIPMGAKPATGSDGAMVIIDTATRRVYEMWQATPAGRTWTASFGAVGDLDGWGWGGAGTGAGASRLGGVIRMTEVANGLILHALAIQVDNACGGVFRAPAVKTDGKSSRRDCIPEGARLRLDPSVNLAALPLTPIERAVGRALQDYGAFVVDQGGAPLSVSFELDPRASSSSVGATYQAAGLQWDYDGMSGLPYSRLQVLS